MLEELQKLPELRNVASDQGTGGKQVTVVVARDTASRLGVGLQQIDDVLYDAFGQRQISTIFTQLNQYRVILEVKPGSTGTLLGGLPLALGTGAGSELRRPLGITIVGGLLLSQMLTLFTTPVIYLAMDRFTSRGKKFRV